MPSPSTWFTVPSKRCTASNHVMDGRIEELLGGFGVEPPDEFGGVFQVGKEHGHLLAFAFQGRASREDLVGEMGWRVGERRPVLGWRSRWPVAKLS